MRKFTKPDLPREHERRIWQAMRACLSVDEAAVRAGASWSWGRRQFVKAGGVSPVAIAEPGGRRYLRFEEREEIMRLQAAGLGVRAIAREIVRHPATISRELKRAVGVRGYKASMAQTHADRGRRGPRHAKLATSLRLRRGPGPAGTPRQPRADRWQTQDRFSRRTGDVGVGRNDLPVALCPSPRWPQTRAHRLSAQRPVDAQAPPDAGASAHPHPRDGDD